MAFSSVFQHRVAAGSTSQNSGIFQHRATAGTPVSSSGVFQHRATAGIPDSFSGIFQHLADVAALGRIRGVQLESPLLLERAVDIQEGSETTSPVGYVRLFAQNGNLRFVNSNGKNVNLGLLGVPLGGVIPWYPPDDATEPPESFEFADGSRVTTIGSPYIGQIKPALMKSPDSPGQTQRFVRGADASGGIENIRAPNVPPTGGSNTHSHSGITSVVSDHEHGPGSIRLPLDGDTANILGALYDPFVGGGVLLIDAPSPDVETLHTHFQDAHDHGGFTSASIGGSVGATDEAGAHSHTITSDTQNNIPVFVDLAYIMRVI